MVATKDVIKDAEHVIERDKDFFMREYKDAKGLPAKAKKLASDIHSEGVRREDLTLFKQYLKDLKKVANDEKWQQFFVGFHKLQAIMTKLLALEFFNRPAQAQKRNRIQTLTSQEHTLEAMELDLTATKLLGWVENRPIHQISSQEWIKITGNTEKLVEVITSLVSVTTEMEEILEEATGVKI